jgi:hypothetical protein
VDAHPKYAMALDAAWLASCVLHERASTGTVAGHATAPNPPEPLPFPREGRREKAWFDYVCALGMAIRPIVALVTLWDDRSSASFVLTAIGLALVVVGVYVVSNVWKEPHYDVMLAWDPEAMPADWAAGRRRYFALNWILAAATWAAFALFLVALVTRRSRPG